MSKNREGVEIDKWEFYDILSVHFNQLKGKLYNVIEASSSSKEQCEAQKGLIKGFCNNHFKNAVDDIESWLRKTGVDMEDDYEKGWIPHPAEPLEERGNS